MPILFSVTRRSVIQIAKQETTTEHYLPTVTPKNVNCDTEKSIYTLHSALRASYYQSSTSR